MYDAILSPFSDVFDTAVPLLHVGIMLVNLYYIYDIVARGRRYGFTKLMLAIQTCNVMFQILGLLSRYVSNSGFLFYFNTLCSTLAIYFILLLQFEVLQIFSVLNDKITAQKLYWGRILSTILYFCLNIPFLVWMALGHERGSLSKVSKTKYR